MHHIYQPEYTGTLISHGAACPLRSYGLQQLARGHMSISDLKHYSKGHNHAIYIGSTNLFR